MIKQQVISEFKRAFNFDKTTASRGIGVECEIPIVEEAGEAVSLRGIQNMFLYLEKIGFQLDYDDYSGLIVAATRRNAKSAENFPYCTDTITTDTAYSTLEVVLAPQHNLHDIQSQLEEVLFLLKTFFDSQNCLMLGCGIQPISPPSRKLLMPKERYCFFEKLSTNHLVKQQTGADSSLLNITASNQCHIEIGLEDGLIAANVLNALSGLQIALHANSPICEGSVDANRKANREMMWDVCFPNRLQQIGIPPAFASAESYIAYLLNFKTLLVKREGQYFQIINRDSFSDFLLNQVPATGVSLEGKERIIEPRADDIEQLIPFGWFNARLVPKYGTVESRMCCQQPQNEMLTPSALTLGLVENLQAAHEFSTRYSLSTWREIRIQAARDALEATVEGKHIVALLGEFLDIAKAGLQGRQLGEEVFLQPLYERIEQRQVPADLAIEVFKKRGMKAFLQHVAFKNEAFSYRYKVA
ncbi:gamma-glutamylcysteine synthetase [Sinobacterium caligoides]|uniref:glutamate--cysteine ligase n=1 Tax=Sinobacterium caligoides TaxID=933926 RepID=A0A3N2DE33_9GAMM|nr:glutamate-cysteine ligase family protein [Sinobacterium caligoides]ROR97918.1 gamma-glutamylcysteine synthetase [Sinobacterium caligoides]